MPEIIKTRDAEEYDGLEVNEEAFTQAAFSPQQTTQLCLHNYPRESPDD